MEVDSILKKHEVFDYTFADFEQNRQALRELHKGEDRARSQGDRSALCRRRGHIVLLVCFPEAMGKS